MEGKGGNRDKEGGEGKRNDWRANGWEKSRNNWNTSDWKEKADGKAKTDAPSNENKSEGGGE